ncbi:filamentous hemagglutinin N-terminal domain-containing protein [Campylobacter lari]|nr:filamentous hemagglutinin N-terminal domain-containing protein [Campylobacter lari]
MKKLANHIILSGVTVSMLFSPLMALPSGGKFTHGTSGSINKPNDKTMNIIGNGKNSVIQWGGGFSIGQGEKVNFGGTDKNYLNIAHGTSKSMIEGILNAGGNNVFLINPNGVIITKTGTINANRFVASTSSMDSKSMQEFADGKYTNGKVIDYTTFSPVFKPSKAGNVVNMGNINANDVLLIGNKVDVQGGKIGNANSTTHLVGKNVYIDVDTKLNSTINVTATDGGYIQRQMIKFAEDKYNFGDNVKVNVVNYKDSNGKTHKGSSNFKKALTIGNMGNEKDNAIEWWHFAKAWNEGLGVTREIDEFRLVGDIDFSGNQGKEVESKDWQNYANYCIDGLGCTSMIVGFDREKVFTKIFDGQGFTLKNININARDLDDNKPTYVGIFGYTNNAHIKNIIVDYNNGRVLGDRFVGGIVGIGINGTFKDISLKNIYYMHGEGGRGEIINVGGFAGSLSGVDAYNIQISNIKDAIYGSSAYSSYFNLGGFAGVIYSGNYNTIKIDNISVVGLLSNIGQQHEASIGGFVGYLNSSISDKKSIIIENITLSKIREITSETGFINTFVGGFLGRGHFIPGFYSFKNIVLNDIKNVGYMAHMNFIGGFAGYLDFWNSAQNNTFFENIFIYFGQDMELGNQSTYNDLFARSSDSLKINNVYVYYDKNGKFANIATNLNKVIEKPYTSSDNLKQDFELKIKDIKTPNFIKNHSDVSLEEDDLISEALLNQIISDLKDKFYAVDINTLNDLLKAYSKIDKNNPASKAEFLANYLLSKDEYPDKETRLEIAHSMIQSLDFLLAYTKNNTGDSKLTTDANNKYLAYQKLSEIEFEKTKNKSNELKDFIKNDLKPLVDESNGYLEDLIAMQNKLDNAIKAYNAYVDLINKGLASKNDPEFIALKNQIDTLMKDSQVLADLINENQKELSTWQNDNNTENFKVVGAFANAILINPKLNEITNDSGNKNDEYQKISRQIADLQKQTPVFEYEEEKTEEVDETSLMQKGKICIVSDNYKTMNPCIVGGL